MQGNRRLMGKSRSIEDALGSLRDQKHRRRRYLGRWPVHGQLQHRGWHCLQDCVALVLWSLASSQGNFSTKGGAVSKTTANSRLVNGEPVAISSSRDFRDVVRERFSWSGVVLALSPTTGRMSCTMNTRMRRASRYHVR
jgi:hypothetical protein